MNESGDVIIAKAEVFGEIGEVITGKLKARKNETTIFKSLGKKLSVLRDFVSLHAYLLD